MNLFLKNIFFLSFIILISCDLINNQTKLDNTLPSITGLPANSSTPQKTIVFHWGCSKENCTYRSVFNRNDSHTFTIEPYQKYH